jgi:hypothetical protein
MTPDKKQSGSVAKILEQFFKYDWKLPLI